ncbi:MAG: glycerol-3-phosphate O-acyltransferase [Limisphaerales bacterium]|jgi:glycerol-3-phosphate O-acyltransferase
MAGVFTDLKLPLDQVVSDVPSWPISRLSRDRNSFLAEVEDETVANILYQHRSEELLHEELASTLYHEKIRLTRKPWSVDPPDEKEFWGGIGKDLIGPEAHSRIKEEEILRTIAKRYSQEIMGRFNPPTYRFARQFIPIAMNRLLNASGNKNFSRVIGNRLSIHDRVRLVGAIEEYRTILRNGGILVMVPTHFSNLDSILVGYAIDAIGLPSFMYGAGINLLSAKVLAYFINRMGAYKIDRRKKNRVYLETLKTYAVQAMMKDCHHLFFPGGTRSRSGSIETKLKMGLLNTVIEAQRRMIAQAGNSKNYRKVYIVPAVISYNFVLEAPVLIKDHLAQAGKERYFVEQDKFSTSAKISKFIFKFFSAGADIWLNFGKPMDILGNPVNAQGDSIDHKGNPIDLQNYFLKEGKHVIDPQRDFEYTRMAADKIVESFHRHNIVLCSHVVSFAAFRIFQKDYPHLDLYQLLRLPEEDRKIPIDRFQEVVARLVKAIIDLEKEGKIETEPALHASTPEVISFGVRNLGIYHNKMALRFNKQKDTILTDDLSLLHFYHNRTEGYGFEQYI